MNKNFLAVIPFLFMSYGYSQSIVDCDTAGYYCNANKPACFNSPKKIHCSYKGKEIKGYVPGSTRVRYLKFIITTPDGQTKEVKEDLTFTTMAGLEGFQPSDAYGYLHENGHITQPGSRIELAEKGVGLDIGTTRFSENADDLFQHFAGSSPKLSSPPQSLAGYLDGNPPDSASNVRCNYLTAPSIIKVVCDKNCPQAYCGTKAVCVGIAKCLINGREFKIHNVHCSARNPARDECPSAVDCISDKSIKAKKLDSKRVHALDHYDDGKTYREEGGAGGAGAVQ